LDKGFVPPVSIADEYMLILSANTPSELADTAAISTCTFVDPQSQMCDGGTTDQAWKRDQPGVWTMTAVPIPPALWLFGSGLLGLIGIARRKKFA